jgi:hypothetical protein
VDADSYSVAKVPKPKPLTSAKFEAKLPFKALPFSRPTKMELQWRR